MLWRAGGGCLGTPRCRQGGQSSAGAASPSRMPAWLHGPVCGEGRIVQRNEGQSLCLLPLKLAILIFFPIFPLSPDSLFPRLTCPQSISDTGCWMLLDACLKECNTHTPLQTCQAGLTTPIQCCVACTCSVKSLQVTP